MPNKQGVTKTRSVRVANIIKRNQAESPLIKLPPEILDKILRFAVGDRLIHIKYFAALEKVYYLYDVEGIHGKLNDEGVFRHSICEAAVGETEAFRRFQAGQEVVPDYDTAEYHTGTCDSRHENCKCWQSSHGAPSAYWKTEHAKSAAKLDLSLLGVCRTTYELANVILWTTNTFSFSGPQSFGQFMAVLNPPQKQKLTQLHLSVVWASRWASIDSPADLWHRYLKLSHVRMLRGLRTLNLCFNIISRTRSLVADDVDPLSVETQARWFEPMMRFRCFELKKLTVIVSDNLRRIQEVEYYAAAGEDRFTAVEKREIARHIMARLTDPQGAANLAAEEAVKHAANKAKRDAWFLPREARRRQEAAEKDVADVVEEIVDSAVKNAVDQATLESGILQAAIDQFVELEGQLPNADVLGGNSDTGMPDADF